MSHLIDEVIISEPGGRRPRRIPVAAPQVSWELSAAGSFSGFVRMDEMRAMGLEADLSEYWLDYPSSAGRWGGVISGRPATAGVAEIVAQGYAALLNGHVISDAVLALAGSAGGLARRAIIQAGVGGVVTFGTIDEGGGSVAIDLTGDVGLDILPQIADAGDVEWVVDADRIFHLARRWGYDRSASVRLIEDRHIVNYRLNDDGNNAATDTFRVQSELSHTLATQTASGPTQATLQPPNNPGVPTLAGPATSPSWGPVASAYLSGAPWYEGLPEGIPVGGSAPGQNRRMPPKPSRQTYTIENPGIASQPSSNAPWPTWILSPIGVGAHQPGVPGERHTAPPLIPTELTLANVDGCFLAFDLGDTIRIDLDSIGICGRFRPVVKALDVTSQTLTVSGELMKDT